MDKKLIDLVKLLPISGYYLRSIWFNICVTKVTNLSAIDVPGLGKGWPYSSASLTINMGKYPLSLKKWEKSMLKTVKNAVFNVQLIICCEASRNRKFNSEIQMFG